MSIQGPDLNCVCQNTDNTGIVKLKLSVQCQLFVAPHMFGQFGHYCRCFCDVGDKLGIQLVILTTGSLDHFLGGHLTHYLCFLDSDCDPKFLAGSCQVVNF